MNSTPNDAPRHGAPAADSTRLVIVDDDALVRAGLTLILGGSPDLHVVGEAADGAQALAVVRDLSPDVVLMDVRMPRMDGLAATRELVADPAPPRIVILTTFDADELVLGALAAGAAGFLLKDTPPEAMVAAIRAVRRGEHTLSPTVMTQVIGAATAARAGREADDAARARARAALETLTDREREVAHGVARGLSNAEIAAELFMSVATVKGHVGRLFDKLGVDNRVQIALRLHAAGLL